jgi:hypothetical protein
MKIVQDSESGQVNIQLTQDEYDIEEHLHSLTDFISKQAIKLHELNNSYEELVKRFDALATELSKANK